MKKECIVMSITNQKGGVGKTTTTVNLGIGLANEGHKVLMIDFDPQGDMTTCLGLTLPLKNYHMTQKLQTKANTI